MLTAVTVDVKHALAKLLILVHLFFWWNILPLFTVLRAKV